MGGADELWFGVSDAGTYGSGGELTDVIVTQVEVLRAAHVPNLAVYDVEGFEDMEIGFYVGISPTSPLERVWVDIYMPAEMTLSIGIYNTVHFIFERNTNEINQVLLVEIGGS